MAEETLLPSADSVNNWDAGTFADVNQGVDTPNDGLTMSDISIEDEIVTFDMDDSALSDGDTITNVTIRTRAQRGSNNGDSLGIDLLIGGSVQGTQVNRALTTSLDDINSNDVGWNTDWTAAQLDGLQVRLTTVQTGMPGNVDITVSEVEVLITYTPDAGTLTSNGTPVIAEITASGISTIIKKATGTVVVAEITASGVSKIIKPSTGTPSTAVITSAGVANLSPRVYLNTSQTLSGATELTVTAYNAAGTSITFDDPIGAPTGALFLGVENRNLGGGDSNTGWIAVTVSAIPLVTNGTPSIDVITASGTASAVGDPINEQDHFRWYANDNADVDLTTALAAEDNTYVVPLLDLGISHHLRIKHTNSGSAAAIEVFRLTVDVDGGGFNVVDAASSNVRTIAGQPVDGADVDERLTDPGGAYLTGEYDDVNGLVGTDVFTGSNTESVFSIEFRAADLSGGETLTFRMQYNAADFDAYNVTILANIGVITADGTPSIDAVTASGASTKIQKATGTPTIPEITASGISTIIKKSSGAVVVAAVVASGVSIFSGGLLTSDGTPSIEEITASGISRIIKKSSGVLSLEEITASGQSTQTLKPSGTPAIVEITASGESGFLRDGSGTVTLPEITASGISTLEGEVTSVGTPSIDEIQASGNVIQRQFLSGTASIDEIVAAGISTILKKGSGTATVDEILAAGVVDQIQKLSGSPSIEVVSASGVSKIIKKSSGALTLSEVEASGVAELAGVLLASGTPSIDSPVATGIAKIIKRASGTPAIDSPTATGVASTALAPKVWLNTTQVLSGATEMTVTAFNGAGTSITFSDPIGAPTGSLFLGVENLNAGGGDSNTGWIAVTVNESPNASGTPSIDVITANGLSNLFGGTEGFPSIAEITASGVSIIKVQPLTASGNPSIEITTAGTVIQTQKVSGALSTEEITASGVSIRFGADKSSSGTSSIAEIEAFGVSTIVVDPVEIRTPTTSYSGKIDLDLARPGDIEDPATDRAINFLHDAVEQLSLSVITEFESIAKGYGGIEQTGTPGISNLGAGFQVVPADANLITTPVEVTQDFANDGIIVERSGVWNVNIIISLSHNEDAAVRTTEIQLYNDTDAVEIEAILVPIARNQPRTFISLVIMVEIPESAEDDLLQIRIGNGSTVTSVVLEAYQFSANHISEFNA